MKKLSIFSVWKKTVKLIGDYPLLVFPFIVLGIFDGLGLLFVYWAPRYPISSVMAPIIRAYWGESFLHYPANFLMLPKLYQGSHILITALIGVVMSGIVILMVRQANTHNAPGIQKNCTIALGKYPALFMTWMFVFVFVTLFLKGYELLVGKNISHIPILSRLHIFPQMVFWLGVILSIIIEAVFVYSLPFLLLEEKNVFRAIGSSISLAFRTFGTTICLVLFPSILYFGIIVLKQNIAALSRSFPPEIVLWILWAGVVTTVIIDCIVTISTTIFFLENKQGEVV